MMILCPSSVYEMPPSLPSTIHLIILPFPLPISVLYGFVCVDYDYINGVDTKDCIGGDLTLVHKRLSPSIVALLAFLCYCAGFFAVLPLLLASATTSAENPAFFYVFLAGILLSVFYTMSPIGLKYLALGPLYCHTSDSFIFFFLSFFVIFFFLLLLLLLLLLLPLFLFFFFFFFFFLLHFPNNNFSCNLFPSWVGDITIFLTFGPLTMQATSLLITNQMSADLTPYAIPITLLTEAILHANNTRDIKHDRKANVATLSILLGHNFSYVFYLLLLISAYGSILYLSIFFRYGLLLALGTVPLAIMLCKGFVKNKMDGLVEETAKFHLLFGVCMWVGITCTHSGLLELIR